eukprot:809_1
MEVVVQGPIIKCPLSNEKFIVFQPYLTKIESIFNVEMKLISTPKDLPIKVHFDIDYKDETTKGYHASLHPREMDIKWNNTFHLTLSTNDYNSKPISSNTLQLMCCKEKQQKSQQTIDITMSAMIHNTNEFGIDYEDIEATNTMVMAHLNSSKLSYAFPDILSIFYGISNSVISILDSISDILFILFLWGLSRIQSYESYEIEKDETKTTYFLMTLSIGNLISVAIAIALYTTNKIQTEPLQRTLLACLFFILSPCLPAFEWLLQKIRSHNRDVLLVYPESDGLLVWFEQELLRNQIFILESVFESCFQVMVQFIAVFALQSIEYKDGYLYTSISISLTVIMSKFILMSYNRKRSTILFNLLCYFMDVLLSLIFALFIGA